MDSNRGTLELNSLDPHFPVKAQLILFRLHCKLLDMLNSHNDIRFIIIDHGFTRKTVYKHSISNNNVLVPVHLSKYISFN